jgi:putative flippase GtrA
MLRVATTMRVALESAAAAAVPVLLAVVCLLVLCLQVLHPLALPHHLDHVQILLAFLQGCSSIYIFIYTPRYILTRCRVISVLNLNGLRYRLF